MFNLAKRFATSTTKKAATISDKRNSLLRDILYSEDARSTELLEFTDDERSQHELIERMWCLTKQNEKDARDELLALQLRSMREAALALEIADPKLFASACGNSEYKQGDDVYLFSPKLRAPTETLPNKEE